MLTSYQIEKIAQSLCMAQGQNAFESVQTQTGWEPRHRLYEEEVKRIDFIIHQLKLAELNMI